MNAEFIERLKSNNIIRAWLVLLLTVFFGSSLAAVDIGLKPIIDQNKANETLEKVPALVLGEDLSRKMVAENQTLTITPRQIPVENAGRQRRYMVYETRYQDQLRGWVIKAAGQGYADRIELLLGVDPALEAITGLYILEQKETPGLGNKITYAVWRDQFLGKKPAEPVQVVKSGAAGQQINAVSGATISSKSVADIISTAAADVKPLLTTDTLVKEKPDANPS